MKVTSVVTLAWKLRHTKPDFINSRPVKVAAMRLKCYHTAQKTCMELLAEARVAKNFISRD